MPSESDKSGFAAAQLKGIYVLILSLNNDIDLRVGKIGTIEFRAGYYYYIGSALGQGGFKRVIRHFRVASGENTTRKWHIDHLLPCSEVISAVLLPAYDRIECKAADAVAKLCIPIPDFGCSDCECDTHLFFCEKDITEAIISAGKEITGNESIIIHPCM